MFEFVSFLIGPIFALVGVGLGWWLRERSDKQRLKAEKLEEIVRAIHRANLLILKFDGKYSTPTAAQEMENAVNEIETLIKIHFPEFCRLSSRIYRAYVLTLTGDSHMKLAGELRGLEQDLLNYWEGSDDVLSKERYLPSLEREIKDERG